MEDIPSFNQSMEKSKILLKKTKSAVTERQGSYTLNQKISLSESYRLEFKEYGWPFNKDLEFTLMKTICSFLNRSGGTILIGVNDDKVVKGIKIKSVDEVKLYFDGLKKRFFPSPSGLIKTVELPIKQYIGQDQEKYNWLPNTYVIRIEVTQGYLDKLYTYTFTPEKSKERRYSSYREDASVETTDSFEKIYEKIYQKAVRPENKAEAIIYDEPNYEGFSESQSVEEPIEHNIKHSYIAFTNIFKANVDQFKEFLEKNLKLQKIDESDFKVKVISEFITIVKSPRINQIYSAIQTIVNEQKKELSALTFKQQPLQFGYLKNQLTFKNVNEQDANFVKSVLPDLNFTHRLKENGDLIVYTSQNMSAVPRFYSFFKYEKIHIFLSFE